MQQGTLALGRQGTKHTEDAIAVCPCENADSMQRLAQLDGALQEQDSHWKSDGLADSAVNTLLCPTQLLTRMRIVPFSSASAAR